MKRVQDAAPRCLALLLVVLCACASDPVVVYDAGPPDAAADGEADSASVDAPVPIDLPQACAPTVWTRMKSGTRTYLRGIWGSSPTDIWVVGDRYRLHFNGKAWTSAQMDQHGTLQGIGGSSATDVHVVGTNGYTYSYDGKSWIPTPTVTKHVLRAVWNGHRIY